MKLTDLEYLSAAAETGNITRAARRLGRDAATISRRIAQVEDELGLVLFERGRFGVRMTPGGKAVLKHVRRALAEIDAIRRAGRANSDGCVGEIRLGVRLPPVGKAIRSLLETWQRRNPDVLLTISELNDREIPTAVQERRLDAALVPSYTLWPQANSLPVYRERIVAALPKQHPLAAVETLNWAMLADSVILVQGWDESQAQRELFAARIGSGARFRAHPASKQSVLALVAIGSGVALMTEGQAEITFPSVTFRPIMEENANVRIDLVWRPEVEEPAVGRFVAFLRDESQLRQLV